MEEWATILELSHFGLHYAVNHGGSTEAYGLNSTPLIPEQSEPRAGATMNPTTL